MTSDLTGSQDDENGLTGIYLASKADLEVC